MISFNQAENPDRIKEDYGWPWYSPPGHAQLCPVCNGDGKVMPKDDCYSTAAPQPVACHGCGGLGWVTVK